MKKIGSILLSFFMVLGLALGNGVVANATINNPNIVEVKTILDIKCEDGKIYRLVNDIDDSDQMSIKNNASFIVDLNGYNIKNNWGSIFYGPFKRNVNIIVTDSNNFKKGSLISESDTINFSNTVDSKITIDGGITIKCNRDYAIVGDAKSINIKNCTLIGTQGINRADSGSNSIFMSLIEPGYVAKFDGVNKVQVSEKNNPNIVEVKTILDIKCEDGKIYKLVNDIDDFRQMSINDNASFTVDLNGYNIQNKMGIYFLW